MPRTQRVDLDPADPANDVTAAVAKAIRVLNAASQTRSGLSRKLTRAGYSAPMVKEACDRLEAMGYVNDRAFVQDTISKRQRQGRGAKLIASELRHKGIDNELIDEILTRLKVEDEVERAAEVAAELLRRHHDEPLVRQREHVTDGLLRRGYAPWVARKALDNASELDS
jgi:regulatory protein